MGNIAETLLSSGFLSSWGIQIVNKFVMHLFEKRLHKCKNKAVGSRQADKIEISREGQISDLSKPRSYRNLGSVVSSWWKRVPDRQKGTYKGYVI